MDVNPTLVAVCIILGGLVIMVREVSSVRLRNVTIPSFGELGHSLQLVCDFSLESDDQLLVLKWYKDEHEFFRFSPTSVPNIVIFNTSSSVHVDIRRSNLYVVTLRNLTLESGGIYRCEVSVDKTFQTLTKQGKLEIGALPLYEPEIFGLPHSSSIGNFIAGKCTSHRSKPAAELQLYVNDELANSYVTEYITITEPDGLYAFVLGFNFTVQPKHVKRDKINVKCTAAVGNIFLVRTQSVSVLGRGGGGHDTKATIFNGFVRFLTGRASGLHSATAKVHIKDLFAAVAILIWSKILASFLA